MKALFSPCRIRPRLRLAFLIAPLLFADPAWVLAQGGPPVILQQPQSQTVVAGTNVTFDVVVSSLSALNYQWRFNGGDIPGATGSSYSIWNVQVTNAGAYCVFVQNLVGSVLSSNAILTVNAPNLIPYQPAGWSDKIVVTTMPGTTTDSSPLTTTNMLYVNWAVANLGTAPTAVTFSNQLYLDNVLVGSWGVNPPMAPGSNSAFTVIGYPLGTLSAGAHTIRLKADSSNAVIESNKADNEYTKAITVVLPAGSVIAWGYNNDGETNVPYWLTSAVGIAAGSYHSLALQADGTVVAWGAGTVNTGLSPDYGQSQVPWDLSNVVAVAAGGYHSLALKFDGTVVAWGAGAVNTGLSPDYGQSQVPWDLSNVVAIAAGGYHSLALKADRTVVAWGAGIADTGSSPDYGQSQVPLGLGDVVAIAAGSYHSLARKSDGTVIAWGANYAGQSNVPSGTNNHAAVAGGAAHSLALEVDGSMIAWGDNSLGQCTIPQAWTNLAAIAAGAYHNLALKNDGTVAAWGDDSSGQTNLPPGLRNVAAVTAGFGHSLALVGDGSVVITVQPASRTVSPGSNVTFVVMAVGTPALQYQWRWNGTNIPGGTATTYTVLNAQMTNAGMYSVVIANATGSVTSSNALLTVNGPVRLIAPRLTTNGFQFRLIGPVGTYVIRASADLTYWIPIATNATTPSGVLDFIDPAAVSLGRRYYRAVMMP